MIDRDAARDILARYRIPSTDFYAFNSETVGRVSAAADEYKYRKPKNANGSRARYFHAFLVKRANRKEY